MSKILERTYSLQSRSGAGSLGLKINKCSKSKSTIEVDGQEYGTDIEKCSIFANVLGNTFSNEENVNFNKYSLDAVYRKEYQILQKKGKV